MGVWGFAAAAHADAGDSIVAGSSGSARWTIPIEVPPGPGGLEPTLALVYSSSAGDGPFGVGWQLPLGEISCSVRHGVPAYINPGGADCPQFELDGELLNPGNGRYHTFVESFQRILDKGYIGWEVTSPDGTIRRYGLNQNSRIVAPSGNVARWLLSSIMDPFGNEIAFDYDGNPSTPAFELPMIGNQNNGHTYIKRIRYGPDSDRVVEVEYESRTDVIHDYAGGVERRIAYRATEIRVESSGSTHSRYRLGYDLDDLHETPTAAQYSTSRSRLAYSIRFGAGCDSTTPLADCTPANGLALPAQEFRYTDPDDVSGTQWDTAAFEGPPISFDEQFYWPSHQSAVRIGDVDGDGLVDIVKADQSTGERKVWINKKTRWELDQDWSEALEDLEFGAPRVNVTVYNYPTSIIEYPYLTKVCAADYVDEPSGVFFADPTFHNALNVQFPYRAQGSAYPPQLYVQLGGNFHLVDLDGDGRADLVMSMRLSGIHRTHDCTTGAELTPWQMVEPNGREVRVVFRNTGTGWVPDTNLAQGLPLFGMVATESDWVGYANGAINYDPCTGLISRDFNWTRDHGNFEVRPCINYADFAPAFADLNGDGRADVIAAAPSAPSPTMVVSNSPRPWELSDNFAVSTTASRAWLWQLGTGWVRDASFDLPFHHAHITFVGDTSGPDQSYVSHSWASTGDAGVRIVDRNRDGLADVTWVDPYQDTGQAWCQSSDHYCPPPQPGGFPQAPRGVLLNRGAGGGQPYSAWCSSQPITGVAPCSSESGAARFELPAGERFAEIGFEQGGVFFTESAGAELGDVNGDGWLDLIRASGSNSGEPPSRETFLFSRGGPTAWVADARFTPPTDLGFVLTWWEGAKRPSDGRLLDLDGDGALDFSHGPTGAYLSPENYNARSWVGKRGLSDLLREVRTGRGGTIQIAYDTGPRRRDVALEASAAGHAGDPAIGEPLGLIGEAHPTPAPVVASVTVEGPNRVPSTTRYRYADRRWDRARRVGLGWRLVEKTQPDGSVVESFFYQKHGRAGRLSERIVWDQNKPVHWSEEVWAVVPPSQADDIPGAWPDATSAEVSHLGRLVSRASRNEYGNSLGQSAGAEQEETFEYDDDYGYNFAKEVHTVRPSTDTIRFLEPATANTNDWIVGLVRERRDEDQRGSGWVSHSTFEYTNEGRLWKESRQRWRGDVTQPAEDLTQYFYDDSGNLRQRIDANGHSTGFGYDSTGSVLTSRTDPAVVQGSPGRITIFTPHPVFGVPFAVDPGYRDVPRVEMTLDAFGRVIETWQIPRDSQGEGEPALVSATNFMDAAWPPYVEQFDYTTADDAIRTAVADDGFGGVWKTIRDAGTTGPGGTGGPRYMGSATVHDPAQRLSHRTYDLPCGSDPWCTSITGGQSPAVVTTADALGRPTQVVDTARGTSLFHYASSHELIAEGDTRSSHPVDVVWSQNAKGDLARRSFDGDRVVAVEECTNSDPDRTSLANATCSSTDGPNRTLYGYHASGQLQIVHDPIGAGAQWGNLHHQLRYHFDTAGFVIAIDDPDAGHSQTYYDPVGNVVGTVNARNQLRATMYDALDRPTKIATPEGNIAFWYRAEELQPAQESSPLYTKIFTYDGFGRVAFESLQGWGTNHTSYDLQGRQTAISPSGLGAATTIRYEYTGAYLTRICSTPYWAPSCSDADATPFLSDVGYDGLGRRKSARLAGGLRTWSYEDEDGDTNPTRDLIGDHFVGASTFTQGYGSRDPLGNLLSWSITTTGQPGLNASGSYTYDARNRLASRTRTADSQAPVEEDFRYDVLGNLITHGGAAQVFAHPTKPHALTSRGTNTYDYDGSGNLVRAGGRHFTFDSADRLVCVGSGAGGCDVLRVVYDAAGARVYEKAGAIERGYHGPDHVQTRAGGTKEVRFDVRAFGELVAYTIQTSAPASASPSGDAFEVPPWWVGLVPLAALAGCLALAIRAGLLVGVARRPGYAGLSGVLIVSLAIPYPAPAWGRSRVTNRYTRWVLADPIGSGVAVLDETGLLLHQTRFAPFGRAEAGEYHAPGAASEPQQRRTFAGHAEQQETGLDYMNARWMDPETGIFLSVDPVIRDIANPQSLNTYSYAENNPIAFNDPTGSCIPVTPCDGKWYGQLPEGAPVPGYAQVSNPGYLAESGVTPGMYAGDIGHVMAGDSVPGGLFDILFPATPSPGIWAANDGQSPDGRWIGGSQQQMQSTVDAGQGVLGAIGRFGGLMGWDLALAFAGNVGNLYGMTRGLVTALAGVAALNPAMIAKGVSQFGWALVPRYGWWSGPGWGKPTLDANHGSWYGPYSSQSVIEYATYRHDYNYKNPGSDAQLIRDVWSRHDLGPYGQVYRVGLTALFGTGIALGFDD